MKIILFLIAGLILLILLYFIYLSIKSHNGEPAGLINQKLSPCPDTPNCITSEFKNDTTHFIDALPYQKKSIDELILIIEGVKNYISATYTSKLFRYIDDLEIRVDSENESIHFRSASRVGRSDFSVNIKRIDLIKNELEIQLH